MVVADRARGEALRLDAWQHITFDRYPGTGSLGGIFSGLAAARHHWVIAVACDMPFLNLDLMSHLLSLRRDSDAVVPVLEGRPEPTHALYSKVCLPFIEERLVAGRLKISDFYDEVRVSYVEEAEIDRLDPDHLSFFNINTREDLDVALNLVTQDK